MNTFWLEFRLLLFPFLTGFNEWPSGWSTIFHYQVFCSQWTIVGKLPHHPFSLFGACLGRFSSCAHFSRSSSTYTTSRLYHVFFLSVFIFPPVEYLPDFCIHNHLQSVPPQNRIKKLVPVWIFLLLIPTSLLHFSVFRPWDLPLMLHFRLGVIKKTTHQSPAGTNGSQTELEKTL